MSEQTNTHNTQLDAVRSRELLVDISQERSEEISSMLSAILDEHGVEVFDIPTGGKFGEVHHEGVRATLEDSDTLITIDRMGNPDDAESVASYRHPHLTVRSHRRDSETESGWKIEDVFKVDLFGQKAVHFKEAGGKHYSPSNPGPAPQQIVSKLDILVNKTAEIAASRKSPFAKIKALGKTMLKKTVS